MPRSQSDSIRLHKSGRKKAWQRTMQCHAITPLTWNMKQTTEAGLSAEFWSLPWCMSSISWEILEGFELLDVPLRWCQHCQWRPASCSCHFLGTPNFYNPFCFLFGGIVSIEAGNIGQCWDASRTTVSLKLWLYFVWSIRRRSDFMRAFLMNVLTSAPIYPISF